MSSTLAATTFDRHYVLRKLHSLSGVLPIGAYLVEHLYTNSYALSGPAAYDEAVHKLLSLPYLVLIEYAVIILPIVFHGVYGLFITMTGESSVGRYGYARNWMYFLQRVSGIAAFVFIAFHLVHFRYSGRRPDFEQVAVLLDNPFWTAFYVVGTLATVYHFANGLWLFLVNWGITIGERAQRISAYVCAAIGVALSVVGIRVIQAFL